MRDALEAVRADPLRYLDCECALSLGALINGYKVADGSAAASKKAVLDRIPGPDQADGCTRAYLARGSGPRGFRYALDEFEAIVSGNQPVPSPGPMAHLPIVEHVRTALASGRIGMYFGEPTIMWVSNYANGFLLGLASAQPDVWAQATDSLQRFEAWMQRRYGSPGARWHELIRVFEGPCERGLQRFVELWDESVLAS